MLILVTVRGNQVTAIRRTGDRNFPLRAAAHRADLLCLGRTKTSRFSLFTNWTKQIRSPGRPKPIRVCLISFLGSARLFDVSLDG